jgi:hypothetical protein
MTYLYTRRVMENFHTTKRIMDINITRSSFATLIVALYICSTHGRERGARAS